MKKIALIITDGFEEIEATTIVDVVRRATIGIDILALNDLHVTGARGVTISADYIFNYYTAKDYDGIVFAGGMANARELAQTTDVLQLIQDYFSLGKLVAAICASPALVLSAAGILEGKSATCYPDDGLVSSMSSANYIDAPVVLDGNLITGQSPATAMEFALEIVKYMGEDSNRVAMDLLGK